jgi:hypothetical protein
MILVNEMILTPEQVQHIEMSRAWVGLFRQLCKKYNSQHWQLGMQTRELFEAVKHNQIEKITALCKFREGHMFFAMHIRCQKVIEVYCEKPSFPKDYAHMGRWADLTVGRNFPFPTFIGHYTPESFANFEELFVQLLRIKTEADVPAFKDYLEKKYYDNIDLLNDDGMEGASCSI